jgi:hypothetical protein
MDLRKIESDDMSWIDLVQDRNKWWALLSTVMNRRIP